MSFHHRGVSRTLPKSKIVIFPKIINACSDVIIVNFEHILHFLLVIWACKCLLRTDERALADTFDKQYLNITG